MILVCIQQQQQQWGRLLLPPRKESLKGGSGGTSASLIVSPSASVSSHFSLRFLASLSPLHPKQRRLICSYRLPSPLISLALRQETNEDVSLICRSVLKQNVGKKKKRKPRLHIQTLCLFVCSLPECSQRAKPFFFFYSI